MKLGIFPKEIDFFEIFDLAASNLSKAASLFFNLMHSENFNNIEVKAKEIYELEQECDILTHEIIKKLNKTFVTPIDREDLYTLASRLDDVIDLIWAAVERLMVFKIKEPTKEAVEMAKDLLMTTEVVQKAIKKLKEKKYSHVQEYCIEINRLENRIDSIIRDCSGENSWCRSCRSLLHHTGHCYFCSCSCYCVGLNNVVSWSSHILKPCYPFWFGWCSNSHSRDRCDYSKRCI